MFFYQLKLIKFNSYLNHDKMYCWENQFAKKINEARKKEIAKIKGNILLLNLLIRLSA